MRRPLVILATPPIFAHTEGPGGYAEHLDAEAVFILRGIRCDHLLFRSQRHQSGSPCQKHQYGTREPIHSD